MQRLVADLLAYSRVGSQGGPLAPVACAGVVQRVLVALQPAIAEAGASFEIGPLPTVQADEGQLGQLLQNLIGNALKFRGEAAPRVRIDARRLDDRWLFSVTDNGIGIEMRYAERIFQMFQRLHERGAFEGSGIGLAIAKRIVERHGGRIWFESAPGAGTTFWFTLADAGPAP
jgi:light-regulated signal transduction histidine kinase (bacteriophytochrome)